MHCAVGIERTKRAVVHQPKEEPYLLSTTLMIHLFNLASLWRVLAPILSIAQTFGLLFWMEGNSSWSKWTAMEDIRSLQSIAELALLSGVKHPCKKLPLSGRAIWLDPLLSMRSTSEGTRIRSIIFGWLAEYVALAGSLSSLGEKGSAISTKLTHHIHDSLLEQPPAK